MKINNYTLFLGSCFLVLDSFLFAQGFQVNLQGQKAQGMGGAGSALMQDGSAVFF